MIASHLSRARDLCHAAAHAVTLAGCYTRDRAEAERHARAAEEALYAALDAIAQAQMSRASFLPVAEAITQTDRRAA
jgi:hypothetical protein